MKRYDKLVRDKIPEIKKSKELSWRKADINE